MRPLAKFVLLFLLPVTASANAGNDCVPRAVDVASVVAHFEVDEWPKSCVSIVPISFDGFHNVTPSLQGPRGLEPRFMMGNLFESNDGELFALACFGRNTLAPEVQPMIMPRCALSSQSVERRDLTIEGTNIVELVLPEKGRFFLAFSDNEAAFVITAEVRDSTEESANRLAAQVIQYQEKVPKMLIDRINSSDLIMQRPGAFNILESFPIDQPGVFKALFDAAQKKDRGAILALSGYQQHLDVIGPNLKELLLTGDFKEGVYPYINGGLSDLALLLLEEYGPPSVPTLMDTATSESSIVRIHTFSILLAIARKTDGPALAAEDKKSLLALVNARLLLGNPEEEQNLLVELKNALSHRRDQRTAIPVSDFSARFLRHHRRRSARVLRAGYKTGQEMGEDGNRFS